MPQNDIKLMHNFTTHLSRHALIHRGYEPALSLCVQGCVCECVCNMCVVSLFWQSGNQCRGEKAHLNSTRGLAQTYVNSTQKSADFCLFVVFRSGSGVAGGGLVEGVATGSRCRSVGFYLFYGIL